jgi:CRP-like cAMP-binding protein
MRTNLHAVTLPLHWGVPSFGHSDLPEGGVADVSDLLKNVMIFRDLDRDELDLVADVCKEETFTSGEYIFHEGEHGNRLYLITKGEVRISRDVPGSGEEALAILKAGAMFGEMAVFDRTERSTHAISNGGTTALTIARPDFEMLLDFNRELAHKVLWAVVRLLSGRLRQTNDSLRSFLAMSMF